MKKSSQSLKNKKKSKPNKNLTGINFEVHKHSSGLEDPEKMVAMINLAMRDSDLKRETKNFSLEYVEILKGRLRLYFKNFHTTTRYVGSDFADKWEENINRGLFKEIDQLEGVLMCSIFMLPPTVRERARIYQSLLDGKAELHFVLEGIILRTRKDIESLETIFHIRNQMPSCLTSEQLLGFLYPNPEA